ncbi:MAG: hypothetical protein EA401_12100 [Planctomycetota bacterium]|nr:MAG: hypothetical protein EA401_12100 [Planctomycetota bacterium]
MPLMSHKGPAMPRLLLGAKVVVAPLLCLLWLNTASSSEATMTGVDGRELPDHTEVRSLAEQGMTWLLQHQQDDGSLFDGPMFRLGITAFGTLALLENGMDADDPTIQKSVQWLLDHQQDDGGFYDPQEGLSNYGTSATLMVLARVDDVDEEVITRARDHLMGNQNVNDDSNLYGGFAYGSDDEGREDLSNTAMAIQGLRAAGVPADHPSMQRALAFVQRTQDLSSVNDQEWAGNSGGATYSPNPERAGGSHADGVTTAEAEGDHAVQPVGTMTYALITSYINLDVPADDPRVQTALRWVGEHYRFDANPGMAAEHERDGLFYYYLMMAATFDVVGTTRLETPEGEADWRIDLFDHIRQSAIIDEDQGKAFWVNESRRWGEGIPHLTTTYMLRALARVHDSLPPQP